MKRTWYILILLFVAAGLFTPAAVAQGPVGLNSEQPAGVTHPDPVADRGDDVDATVVLDDFNRPDGPIGPDWTVHDGNCNVSNDAAVCSGAGRATFNSAPGDGNVAEADVAVDGTALQYTGLLLNYGAGVNNLFLKVQQQSPYLGQFTHAACRIGNNNGSDFGLGFFPLDAPFSTAHMKATRVGSDVTIEFTDIDGGGGSQTYVCTGAPAPEGTGIGILGYTGIARLDNFGIPGADIAWDKTIDGIPWTPGISVTRQTSDTIVVEDVLHLLPPPPVQESGIQAIFFDGSPITNAPPATLGPYTMTPFPLDGRPVYSDVVAVPGPTGPILFDIPLNHRRIGDGWASWSHGYTGDVYFTNGITQVVITMPPDTGAFYFYVEPNPFAVHPFTATAQDGTTSGPIPVDGDSGATYFGFYATGGDVLQTITIASDVDFAVGEFGIAGLQAPVFAQTEAWNPAHLHLLDWAVSGGTVIIEPGHLTWTGEITTPVTIVLTKWFHVEPCTWTETLLWEELWLNDMQLEERPVLIHKLPPMLWIDSVYEAEVYAGSVASFTLVFSNTGGFENDIMIRNDFPPGAPFVDALPLPDRVGPGGLWAEWDIPGLPHMGWGEIDVYVALTGTLPPSSTVVIWDGIFDHVGVLRDDTLIEFYIGESCDPPMNLDMSWTPPQPGIGVDVTFSGYATGTEPLNYEWWFDGAFYAAGMTTTRAFTEAGDYEVWFRVYNDCGDEIVTDTITVFSETVCVTVTINDITYDQDGCSFDFAADVYGTPPYTYLWHFGDGMTSTEEMPTHVYAAGDYTVTLEVWNCEGAGYDVYEEMVSCEICEPPSNLAMMWSPLQPGVDEVVTFSGSADGSEPMTYEWWFDGVYYATGASITRTFAMTGDYEVWFRATNGCGDEIITDTLTIYTETICVPVVINDVATDITGCVVDFAPDLSGDIPITFMWSFGDGMTDTVEMPSHDYGASGTYTVTLEVENCAGAGMDDYTFTVAVSCEPPLWTVYLPLVFKNAAP